MNRNQQEGIDRILDLLPELVDDEPANTQAKASSMEMLMIKKCIEAVRGISEHTIRNYALKIQTAPEPFRDGFQAFLFPDDLHDLRRLQNLAR